MTIAPGIYQNEALNILSWLLLSWFWPRSLVYIPCRCRSGSCCAGKILWDAIVATIDLGHRHPQYQNLSNSDERARYKIPLACRFPPAERLATVVVRLEQRGFGNWFRFKVGIEGQGDRIHSTRRCYLQKCPTKCNKCDQSTSFTSNGQ
jgi:hypothetical protein